MHYQQISSDILNSLSPKSNLKSIQAFDEFDYSVSVKKDNKRPHSTYNDLRGRLSKFHELKSKEFVLNEYDFLI